jgi:hypothetical protein
MDVRGEKCLKKSRRKGKTKEKHFLLEDLQKKTKTICKLKVPLKEIKIKIKIKDIYIYISLTFHNLWKKNLLFQHLHLYIFPKQPSPLGHLLSKAKKIKSSHTFTPF